MSRGKTNPPEYGTELKLAAVAPGVGWGKRECSSAGTWHSAKAAVCVEGPLYSAGQRWPGASAGRRAAKDSDVTGQFCTKWKERESTGRKSGHADEEVQARANRDDAAAN